MSHTITKVGDLKPGMLVYAAPGNLIVQDVLTSQTLKSQQKDKHPLVILTVNADAQEITVTYVASFVKSGSLGDIKIPVSAKQLFVPVAPATKEFAHDVIQWQYHWDPNHTGCWVSVRNKKKLTGAEFKVFDQYFSADTAAHIDSLIKDVVE